MNQEQAVQEFMGDRPGAEQLREWRETLQRRLEALEQEKSRAGAQPIVASTRSGPSLDARIAQLKKQVAALSEEAAITEFVEDSVRVTLAMGATAEEAPAEEWE